MSGINVKGESVKLWVNPREGRNGNTWNDYSVGISSKRQDGGYDNASIKVKFSSKLNVPKDIPNGTMIDFAGFVKPDIYKDRNGNEVKRDMYMITQVKFHDLYENNGPTYDDIDSFSEAEDDIPF